MTTPAVWVPLLIAFATGACTWATLMIRLMWQFRGKWDFSNAQLARVAERITELAASDSRIEQRLERHLDWHDRH
jgi:hypothetical protein